MWFRRSKMRVENLETGASFTVRKIEDARLIPSWEVVFATTAARTVSGNVLAEGYKTEEEAIAALDDFLSEMGVTAVALQPPVTEEETAEDE